MNLFQNEDGACAAAKAVRAYLADKSGIESSWSKEQKRYLAEPAINRWHNCREQGYIVSLRSVDYAHQLNIAFFEHRNSDTICAIGWVGKPTLNPPTLSDIPDGVYEDKYDLAHTENSGGANSMAEWVYERMELFWSRSTVANSESWITKLLAA